MFVSFEANIYRQKLAFSRNMHLKLVCLSSEKPKKKLKYNIMIHLCNILFYIHNQYLKIGSFITFYSVIHMKRKLNAFFQDFEIFQIKAYCD